MSQACYFTNSETKNNPLYNKMRERFSFGGSMTIGEIMLNRAARAEQTQKAAPVQQAKPQVRPAVKKAAPRKFEKHHATALSCILLAFVAVALIVVLLSTYTELSITASPADAADVVSESGSTQEAVTEIPAPESSFENVLNAMYQSFGE